MNISRIGIQLIKDFESCKLNAYLCPAGIPTIGYGATGPDVHIGMVWTQEQADDRLERDLERFEHGIEVMELELKQCQFDALVSFAFNCGLEALRNSTLLKYIRQGMFPAAANEFVKWCRAGGVELRGLKRRRLAEKALFQYED